MAIVIKSVAEIADMRAAGRINALALQKVCEAIRPGVRTRELDHIAAEVLRAHGAEPAFLGYPNSAYPDYPYPATINVSVNDELVHGIPGSRRLREGDIVSVDCGTVWKGVVGDSAVTVPVGHVSAEARRLIEVTREALRLAIAACRPENRLGDVSATIQDWAESQGCQVVREYTGHGVGYDMHEDPQIPNWGTHGRGPLLRPGMTLALEPMLAPSSISVGMHSQSSAPCRSPSMALASPSL